MPLLKHGAIVADRWYTVAAGEPVPESGAVIVPFERWRTDRATLLRRNTPLGVRLTNTQLVAELAADLDRFDVIVLEFPKFIDGRAFTQARLLRERYGYRHELRAAGNVLRDELQFMQRCGFDVFEVDAADPVESWRKATSEIDVFYQPAADDRVPVMETRRRHA